MRERMSIVSWISCKIVFFDIAWRASLVVISQRFIDLTDVSIGHQILDILNAETDVLCLCEIL
ncbi:protein of unknown function (plasmid) [Rhodovastum atsumiense]|nr:protein of unknown function [Rhodovastum atsumiense]